MTELEGLVVTLEETLAVFVLTLVVMIVTAMIVMVATNVFLVVVSTMRIAMLVAAIVTPVALIHKVVNLVVVALCHSVAEFAFGTELNLFLTLFESEPSATCELKMLSKYLAPFSRVSSQRHRPLSRYLVQSSWRNEM